MNREQLQHFQTHGWALIPDAVSRDEIDSIQQGLFEMYPTPDQFHNGIEAESARVFRQTEESTKPADEAAFRTQQFAGLIEFPFKDVPLSKLAVHENIIRIGQAALASNQVRLYQGETFAKYTGVTNYDQAWHVDYTNHTMLPLDRERGYMQIQMFLYLSDVTKALGATKIVSRTLTKHLSLMKFAFPTGSRPGITDEEHDMLESNAQSAEGQRGSLLIYSSDVVHKGTNMTQAGGSRFFFNLGYKLPSMDWIGANPWPRKGVHDWVPFIESLSLQQLEVLGFPMPGNKYWTESTLQSTSNRYPGLNLEPWFEQI